MLKTKRQSNFELLRIIAIFCIIVHHILINDINVCGYNNPYNYEDCGIIPIVVNSIAVGGVNMFILISGWFGIKHIYRGVIRLILDCILFGAISVFIGFYFFKIDYSLIDVLKAINIKRSWFIMHYILLMLFSPLIEIILNKVTKREFKKLIVLLTLICCVFGWILHVVNPTGYNVLNFIYLYCIGRFLQQNRSSGLLVKIAPKVSLLIWVGTIVLETLLFILLYWLGFLPKSIVFWAYNSPWVLISSISLFLYFSTLAFRNRLCNITAMGVLGVYLLHSGVPYRQFVTVPFFEYSGYCGLLCAAIVIFVGATCISVPTELMVKRMTELLYNKYLQLFVNSK